MKDERPLSIKETENEINQERGGCSGLLLSPPPKNIQFSHGLSAAKHFKLIF
jgi:hypothetical protein